MPVIRPYRESDLPAVYDICVRTADAGRDARGKYRSDDLMPDLFAGPYVFLAPELAFVLDDDGQAVGYVLGTADTASFVRAYRERWIPKVAGRYPPFAEPLGTPDDEMIALHHNPERMLLPELADYPAHLHIDLLPDYQRAGYGRVLIENFLTAVAEAGCPAGHLGALTENAPALDFYRQIGFHPIVVANPGPVSYFGYHTG
jgi:ribosomal protein S18 acetylase RimI-like enzyme